MNRSRCLESLSGDIPTTGMLRSENGDAAHVESGDPTSRGYRATGGQLLASFIRGQREDSGLYQFPENSLLAHRLQTRLHPIFRPCLDASQKFHFHQALPLSTRIFQVLDLLEDEPRLPPIH
jgi:hypothetical protein